MLLAFTNSLLFLSLEITIAMYLLACISYCVVFANLGAYSFSSLLKASTSYSIFVFSIVSVFLLNSGVLTVESFNGFVFSNSISSVFQILLFVSTISLFILFRGFYNIRLLFLYEYDLLVIFSILGLLLLSVVNDFTMLYIAIELQSLSFYLLASF
jgi:NADH:ubiquinone oxidoreductase subunit 2 (subunit N)